MSAQTELQKVLTDGPEEVRDLVSQICKLLAVLLEELEPVLASTAFTLNLMARGDRLGRALADSLKDEIGAENLNSGEIKAAIDSGFDKSSLNLGSQALILALAVAKLFRLPKVTKALAAEAHRRMTDGGDQVSVSDTERRFILQANVYLAQDPGWWHIPEFQSLVTAAKLCFPIENIGIYSVLVSSACYMFEYRQNVDAAIRNAIADAIFSEVISPFNPAVAQLIERFKGRIKHVEQEENLISTIRRMLSVPMVAHNISIIASSYFESVSSSAIEDIVNAQT